MSHTIRIHSPWPVAWLAGVAVALGVGACGESSSEQPSHEAANTSVQAGNDDLGRFLMRDNEEPGFRRDGRARTDSGVTAFVKNAGLTQADARQLRSAGFTSITFQPIRGPRTYGVTNVHVFETAKGAKDWMARELRPDVMRKFVQNIRRFPVPGVPGARGFTASKQGHKVGHVYWVQGRCMLVLGNEGPGPFAGPLSTGARAIYRRTCGQCP